jgi:hypothetical protein
VFLIDASGVNSRSCKIVVCLNSATMQCYSAAIITLFVNTLSQLAYRGTIVICSNSATLYRYSCYLTTRIEAIVLGLDLKYWF